MFVKGGGIGPGQQLTHGNGVNSTLEGAYFNAQDPRLQGGKEFRKHERYHHRTIACMAANGCREGEIAAALDLHVQTVYQILRQPYCQAAMLEMQQKAGVDELKFLIEAGRHAIVRVVERAKNPTVDLAVRQRDDHILVHSMVKVLKPENVDRPFIQLSDAEITAILLEQKEKGKAIETSSTEVHDDSNGSSEPNESKEEFPTTSPNANQPGCASSASGDCQHLDAELLAIFQ